MIPIKSPRCFIGEGPIWNDAEKKLYFTNGGEHEICIYDPEYDNLTVRKLPFNVAAFVFDKENRVIVSHSGGVHILCDDDTLIPIYDNQKYTISNANDMKVGPDGAIYVGTQSDKRLGVSDKANGKLYRISRDGEVSVLLDELLLSNGMDWSMDEKKFYHTDSDTEIIKEYDFDRTSCEIRYTGRCINVPGVDGFTIDENDMLYVACWGKGRIAVVDTRTMQITDSIPTPCRIPASCGFCGNDMKALAVTTAAYKVDTKIDTLAGFTLLHETNTRGRLPYIFS